MGRRQFIMRDWADGRSNFADARRLARARSANDAA